MLGDANSTCAHRPKPVVFIPTSEAGKPLQGIKRILRTLQVYLMADTSYNSQAVDEVAAQHANAECVIHYGYASFSPVSRLPAFFVLPKEDLDCASAAAKVEEQLQSSQASCSASTVLVLHHQGYDHLQAELESCLSNKIGTRVEPPPQLVFARIPTRQLDPSAMSGRAPGPSDSSSTAATAAAAGEESGSKQCMQDSCICAGIQAVNIGAPSTQIEAPGGEGGCRAGRNNSSSQRCQAVRLEDKGNGIGGSCSDQSCCSSGPSQPAVAGCGAAAASCRDQGAKTSCTAGNCPNNSSNISATDEGATAACCEAGLCWRLPAGVTLDTCLLLWLGPLDSPTLTQLQLTHNSHNWAMFDPASGVFQTGLSPEMSRLLKRRYFLVEKAREASIVGLLVSGIQPFLLNL